MEDYKQQDEKLTHDFLIIGDKFHSELQRLKIDRITDEPLLKYLEYFEKLLKKMVVLYKVNPRFDWVFTQVAIDNLHSKDKNISGVFIDFYWKDGEKRGYLELKIS